MQYIFQITHTYRTQKCVLFHCVHLVSGIDQYHSEYGNHIFIYQKGIILKIGQNMPQNQKDNSMKKLHVFLIELYGSYSAGRNMP